MKYKDKEEKNPIEKLQEFLDNPQNTKVVTSVNVYNSYTKDQAIQAWREWKQYYIDVETGESSAIFHDMGDAFKRGDMARVKELAAISKEKRERADYMQKPRFIDPYWVNHDPQCQLYRTLLKEKEKAIKSQTILISTGIFNTPEERGIHE